MRKTLKTVFNFREVVISKYQQLSLRNMKLNITHIRFLSRVRDLDTAPLHMTSTPEKGSNHARDYPNYEDP